jgi:hypothetical protein
MFNLKPIYEIEKFIWECIIWAHHPYTLQNLLFQSYEDKIVNYYNNKNNNKYEKNTYNYN